MARYVKLTRSIKKNTFLAKRNEINVANRVKNNSKGLFKLYRMKS